MIRKLHYIILSILVPGIMIFFKYNLILKVSYRMPRLIGVYNTVMYLQDEEALLTAQW